MSSGPIHQALTSAQPISHRPKALNCLRYNNTMAAVTHAANVAVASIVPMHSTGTTAAAICRQDIRLTRNGATTQGARMTGQVAEEIAVNVVSARGMSAYTKPPSTSQAG